MSDVQCEMPKYCSHKIVHALKIEKVTYVDGNDNGIAVIMPADEGYASFQVDAEYTRKHKPKPGGYYVVYKDGYKSWSPAKAFEEGYTKVT